MLGIITIFECIIKHFECLHNSCVCIINNEMNAKFMQAYLYKN